MKTSWIPVVPALLVACLAAAGLADAQAPMITEVPAGVAEPARGELMRERVGLVERRAAIAGKVGAHNERCSTVPEGSPLEAACAKAHEELSVVIGEYRSAVEAFNAAVAAAPRTRP